MSIQSSVNSIFSSVARTALVGKNLISQRNELLEKQKLAQQQVKNRQEAKQEQKRNFMDYLKQQQTSLGKVGDLPENIQTEIAKSYSQADRERLMDEMDKEKVRNGNKQK